MLLPLKQHITDAFRYTRKRGDLIVWYLAVLFVGFFVLPFLFLSRIPVSVHPAQLDIVTWLLVLFLGFSVLMLTFAAATGIMYVAIRRDESCTFWTGFQWAVRHVVPLSVIGLYTQLLYIFGFLLLIVPGLMLSVYLSMSLLVCMSEEYRGIDALIRSTDLVVGSFWSVVSRGAVVIIPYAVVAGCIEFFATKFFGSTGEVIGGLVTNLMGIIFTVFVFFYLAILLDELRKKKPVFDVDAYVKLRYVYRGLIILGVAALLSIFYMVFSSL